MKYIILLLLSLNVCANDWYQQPQIKNNIAQPAYDPITEARNRVWNQLSMRSTPYPLIDPVTGYAIPDNFDYYAKLNLIDNLNKPINCNIIISNTIRMIQQYNMSMEQMLYYALVNNIDLIARFCS